MSKLTVPIYNSQEFIWSHFVGTAFLTDLCGRGKLYARLYDDALDEGLQVKSRATGRIITFFLHERTNGDPCEFVFHSVDAPGQSGKYKLRVLNT